MVCKISDGFFNLSLFMLRQLAFGIYLPKPLITFVTLLFNKSVSISSAQVERHRDFHKKLQLSHLTHTR